MLSAKRGLWTGLDWTGLDYGLDCSDLDCIYIVQRSFPALGQAIEVSLGNPIGNSPIAHRNLCELSQQREQYSRYRDVQNVNFPA